jgi:two-component system chemotaxis response regulator CheB
LKTIRIVAADDSAVMRGLLTRMFAMEQMGACAPMQLCATVPDGASCLHAVRTLHPDVVLLDLHMPGLGGLEAIVRLRQEWPCLPIIMCSAATADGAAATLEALAKGASDYVTKPAGAMDAAAAMEVLWAQLAPRILALVGRGDRVGSMVRRDAPVRLRWPQVEAVGIGVSTGGPAALERLLTGLPKDFPVPVLVVQHMPKLFTSALVARLDRCCAMRVRQATAGAVLRPGTIWIAPGESHIEVKMGPHGVPCVGLREGGEVQRCGPAVDVLFRSMAEVFGDGALGLVLTGMGADGVVGARAIVEAGGSVLAQDEASSVVWGMPGRVVAAGLAQAVLPLDRLGRELVAMSSVGRCRRVVAAEMEAQYECC